MIARKIKRKGQVVGRTKRSSDKNVTSHTQRLGFERRRRMTRCRFLRLSPMASDTSIKGSCETFRDRNLRSLFHEGKDFLLSSRVLEDGENHPRMSFFLGTCLFIFFNVLQHPWPHKWPSVSLSLSLRLDSAWSFCPLGLLWFGSRQRRTKVFERLVIFMHGLQIINYRWCLVRKQGLNACGMNLYFSSFWHRILNKVRSLLG